MEALQRGLQSIWDQLTLWGPRIVLGVVLVLIGWVVAKLLQKWVASLAQKAGVDKPFGKLVEDAEMPTISEKSLPSRMLGILVFWLVMLFIIVGFLTSMQLTTVAQPLTTLLNRIGGWLPNLLGALFLVIAGWLAATVVRTLIVRLMSKIGLDQWLAKSNIQSEEAAKSERFASIVGVVGYSLVLFLFIPTALDVLGLHFVADSFKRAMDALAESIPGILVAIMVLGVAALIAYLIRPPITRLLSSTGVDRWGKSVGLTSEEGATISSIGGHVVFWAVLLFAFPAALDKLGLEPIVTPLRNAWERAIVVLPNVAAAIGIGVGAWILGRIVGPLVERLLHGIGLDNVLGKMGLSKYQQSDESRWSPSKLGASIAVFAIYLVLAQEAMHTLGMTYLADMLARMVNYLPNLLVSVAIFGVALYLGSLVGTYVRQATSVLADSSREIAAIAANVAVVVFGGAMALAQLQVGGQLVEQTVLLIVGAACLAAALAVGLGSRRLVQQWLDGQFGKSAQ